MGGQALLVTIVVLVVVVSTLQAAVAPFHNVLVKPGKPQKCVCMNAKWCEGEIINDMECHPNYIMVCCIQAEPEPNPPYPLYPSNRFEIDSKGPEQEKETGEALRIGSAEKPLPEEVIIKETPLNKPVRQGEDSSEASSESSEENIPVKEGKKQPIIQAIQV